MKTEILKLQKAQQVTNTQKVILHILRFVKIIKQKVINRWGYGKKAQALSQIQMYLRKYLCK